MSLATAQLLSFHRAIGHWHARIEPSVVRAHGSIIRASVTRPRPPPAAQGLWRRGLRAVDDGVRRFVGEHLYFGSDLFARQSNLVAARLGTGGSGFCQHPYCVPLPEVDGRTRIARDIGVAAYERTHQVGWLVDRILDYRSIVTSFDAHEGWSLGDEVGFGVAALAVASALVGLQWRFNFLLWGIALSAAHAVLWHLEDLVWPQRRRPTYPTLLPPTQKQVEQAVHNRLSFVFEQYRATIAEGRGEHDTVDDSLLLGAQRRAQGSGDTRLGASVSTLGMLNLRDAQRRRRPVGSRRGDSDLDEQQHADRLQRDAASLPWSQLLRQWRVQRKLFGDLPHRVLDTQVFMLCVEPPIITSAWNQSDDLGASEFMFRLSFKSVPVQWHTRSRSPIDADCSLLGEPQLFIYMRPSPEEAPDVFDTSVFYDPSGVYRP